MVGHALFVALGHGTRTSRVCSLRWALRAVLAVVAALAVTGPQHSAGYAAVAPLQTLVLQQSDVPHGFVRTRSLIVRNAQIVAAHQVTAAQAQRFGRIIGYEVEYDKGVKAGLLGIRSEAVAFRTGAGAAQYFDTIAGPQERGASRGVHFRRLGASTIGSRRSAFAVDLTSAHTTLVSILFQRGAYVGLIQTAGRGSGYGTSPALQFAGILDRRLKDA